MSNLYIDQQGRVVHLVDLGDKIATRLERCGGCIYCDKSVPLSNENLTHCKIKDHGPAKMENVMYSQCMWRNSHWREVEPYE